MEKIKRGEIFFSYAVVLLPFLYQYRGLGNFISFGEMLLIPFIGFYLVWDLIKHSTPVNCPLLCLYTITTVSALLNGFEVYFNFEHALTLYSRLVFYAALIFVARKHFIYDIVCKFYAWFAVFISIYAIIQYLYHFLYGGYLPFYFSYELLFEPEARGSDIVEYYNRTSLYRVSSMFLEPGYMVLYIFPALIEILIREKNFFKGALVAIAIVLSGSAAGFVGLVIIFLGTYNALGNKSAIYKLIFIVLTFVFICLLCIYGFLDNSLARVYSNGSFGGSFDDRIINGILIFHQLPIYHKFFGTGLNNTGDAMDYYGISTGINMWGIDKDYCASIFSLLNGSGIIALIILVWLFIGYWRQAISKRIFILLEIFAFILSYEAILYTYRFAFYIILIEAFIRMDCKNKMEGKEYEGIAYR